MLHRTVVQTKILVFFINLRVKKTQMGKFSITGNRTHVWKLFPNYLIHLVKADFMFQTILCKLPGNNQFPFIAKKGVSLYLFATEQINGYGKQDY